MSPTDIALMVVGAFYAFAGFVASRAALTSYFIDRAIAAIAAEKPKPSETAQFLWLLGAASVILAGGLALMLRLEVAAWLFLVSALGQAAYLFVVAPRWFDAADPPDAKGRRQSANAFVLYAAATAFVLWAAAQGRLLAWHQVPWPLLALAGAALGAYAGHVASLLARRPGSLANVAEVQAATDPSRSRRVKVMADYDCQPLWALDEGLYGDFAPDALGLSPELTHDLKAWAEAFTASVDRDDPATSLWSEDRHREHEARGRSLAERLARERPDLEVYAWDRTAGAVAVRGEEAG
jgi:hypothetical protein